MEKDGLYKINILFQLILAFYSLYFPPAVFSSNATQLNTSLSISISEEGKGFLGEIEDAVKNEKQHVQEILDSQTDRASRNLIIIAGAIVIPVSLFLILWILKLLFNISFSVIRSLFSASASGVGAILVNFVSRSVTNEHINMALTEQKNNPDRPLMGQLLIKFGFATAGEVDAALKIQGKKADKNKT